MYLLLSDFLTVINWLFTETNKIFYKATRFRPHTFLLSDFSKDYLNCEECVENYTLGNFSISLAK